MASEEKEEKITEETVEYIKSLIGTREAVNLEWLKTVTQLPAATISKIVIQNLGMVVLEGTVFKRERAEKKLKQMQQEAQADVDRESFRKGPVEIDMMKLREKLWTVMFNERIFGSERHQYCPIWTFLEEDNSSSIILRYDWINRLEEGIKNNVFSNLRTIQILSLVNELGENFKDKARVIFARTFPRNSIFAEDKPVWIMFLITIMEGGVKIEGLNMINVQSISTKYKSRELAYDALNEYIELINFLVSDPSIFEEIIIGF